jgi:NitT/TauT family transport system substrate-binding protein
MSDLTRRTTLLGATALAFTAPFVRSSKAATPVSFRLDWSIYGSHAPFFLALEEKMFEKAGLDVSIGEGQGSATVAKLVGQGNDPLGFVDFTSMIRAVEQGIPLVAIQRVLSNIMCVISNAEDPIRSPKELEGKIVAYGPAESTGQMMPALLQQSNTDANKISVLTPAFGAKNAMFLQRRVDAIPANINVQVAQLEAQRAKLFYFLFSDFGVEMMKVLLLRQLDLTFPALDTRATKGKAFGFMADGDWRSNQELLLKYGGLGKQVALEKLYTNKFLEA